jgi:hypothetical protein
VKLSRRVFPSLLLSLLILPAVAVAGHAYGHLDAGALTASAVTHQSAVLSGSATAAGDDDETTWLIRYGTTPDLLQATKPQRVPPSVQAGPVGVHAALTGLPAGTQIFARLEVAAGKHEEHGDVLTFTTAPAPATTPADPATTPADPATPPGSGDAPADPATPAPGPPAAPQLGASFGAAAQEGSVRVRLPGTDRFVDLPDAASLPVGTVVDARNGAVVLTTALADGEVQRATFGGGRFAVRQPASGDGLTGIHLRGGRFAACRTPRSVRTLASAAGKRPRSVRRVWGKDRGGRFRTYGRDSVTTVRGTEWSVADRCKGTVTRVTEGAVDVKVRRTGRVVRLEAGERFLARHHRR